MIPNFAVGISIVALATYLWFLDSRVTVIEQAELAQPTFYGSSAPDLDKSVFIPVAAPSTTLDRSRAGGPFDTSFVERESNSGGPTDGSSRALDLGQSIELNSLQTKQVIGVFVDAERGYPEAYVPPEVVNIGQAMSAPVPHSG